MSEQMELGDILSNKEPQKAPPAESVTPPAAAPAAPAPTEPTESKSKKKDFQEKEFNAQAEGAGKLRDPVTGQFVDKVTPETPAAPAAPAAPVAPAMTEKEKALLAAALDERNKRQALERQLAEARAARPATPAEPPKQFWDDPEGTLNAFKQEMAGVVVNTRLQTAEMIARSKHPDFEEKVQIFAQLVQQNPGLWQQTLASADPAEFAYTTGKNHKALQDAGSIDGLRAEIKKETRLEMEEEFKKKQEDAIKERDSIPPSLSDAHGISLNKPVWGGPTPLDNILKP